MIPFDILRMLLLHPIGADVLMTSSSFLPLILEKARAYIASSGTSATLMTILLRALSNLFRFEVGRKRLLQSLPVLTTLKDILLSLLSSFESNSEVLFAQKNIRIAISFLLANVTLLMTVQEGARGNNSALLQELGKIVMRCSMNLLALEHLIQEVLFASLLAIGSLAVSSLKEVLLNEASIDRKPIVELVGSLRREWKGEGEWSPQLQQLVVEVEVALKQ